MQNRSVACQFMPSFSFNVICFTLDLTQWWLYNWQFCKEKISHLNLNLRKMNFPICDCIGNCLHTFIFLKYTGCPKKNVPVIFPVTTGTNKDIYGILIISAFHGIFYFHSTPFQSLAFLWQEIPPLLYYVQIVRP